MAKRKPKMDDQLAELPSLEDDVIAPETRGKTAVAPEVKWVQIRVPIVVNNETPATNPRYDVTFSREEATAILRLMEALQIEGIGRQADYLGIRKSDAIRYLASQIAAKLNV